MSQETGATSRPRRFSVERSHGADTSHRVNIAVGSGQNNDDGSEAEQSTDAHCLRNATVGLSLDCLETPRDGVTADTVGEDDLAPLEDWSYRITLAVGDAADAVDLDPDDIQNVIRGRTRVQTRYGRLADHAIMLSTEEWRAYLRWLTTKACRQLDLDDPEGRAKELVDPYSHQRRRWRPRTDSLLE